MTLLIVIILKLLQFLGIKIVMEVISLTKKCTRILGIDPGFGILGYGLIDINGTKISPVTYGVVQTKPGDPIPERLIQIYEELETLITQYKPDEAAVEELFFFRNVTTAIQVGEARGVVLLILRQMKIPIYEYTPHQVKQAVTGYGKAEKGQIQRVMKTFLHLKKTPKPNDAADALAVAWCHFSFRSYPGGARKP